MFRPLRIEFPAAIYHVTSHGNRREPTFDDDLDRYAFLEIVGGAFDWFDAWEISRRSRVALQHNHVMHYPKQPIEILRTIHSFDPCIACAVHVTDPDGEELVQVKIK